MAKTSSKTSVKTAVKKTSATPKSKAISPSIDKACEESLKKLKELGLDPKLQADIQWCLGSFKADKNPTGLYEMAENALRVFSVEKEKKTKGITAKLIGDLEKALRSH